MCDIIIQINGLDTAAVGDFEKEQLKMVYTHISSECERVVKDKV